MERQEFLAWVLDSVDRAGSPDNGMLRLLLPMALQYLGEFVLSELSARKLAFLSARRLSHLCSDSSPSSGSPNSPAQGGNNGTPAVNAAPPTSSQLAASFSEYLACPHHRDVVMGLSAILQVSAHC